MKGLQKTALSLFVLLAISGCGRTSLVFPGDDSPPRPRPDGGLPGGDGSPVPDGTPLPDGMWPPDTDPPPPECSADIDCDDGDACTGVETCQNGQCTPGQAVVCHDELDCTVDACHPDTGLCQFQPDHQLCLENELCLVPEGCTIVACSGDDECSDDLFCNGDEQCGPDGLCATGAAPSCDDDVECTIDFCDEVTDGCSHTANDGLCDNGVFCDGEERCDATVGCLPGEPFDCQSDDPCREGLCVEEARECRFLLLDNDDDGFAPRECGGEDCDDDNQSINPSAPEVCDDGADNDCDQWEDCSDSDCTDDAVCQSCEAEDCSNGLDDDCDDAVDCDDEDCSNQPECCEISPEQCDDDIDNDCDDLVDCDDDDCADHDECCVASRELCRDERDNDCDGRVDCDDEDCARSRWCMMPRETVCWDGVDNDGDGRADCADRDCLDTPTCAGIEPEVCDDGEDNDRDGQTDCSDSDCLDDPFCVETNDTCTNAVDISGGGTFYGTTAGLNDDYQPQLSAYGCAGGLGADGVYYFYLDAPAAVSINTYGSDYDTVLYVRAGHCTAGEQVGCNDDTGGLQSEVNFARLEEGIYFVFIDGYWVNSEGDFVLHLTIDGQQVEHCDDGRDNDGDDLVDCDDPDCDDSPDCRCQPELELGPTACSDGEDNDCDDLIDCDDRRDCAVVPALGECCDGADDNGNGVVDEFACRCEGPDDCPGRRSVCYDQTVGACGPPCNLLGGTVFCQLVSAGSRCDTLSGQCVNR
jgi:hypothetical protein